MKAGTLIERLEETYPRELAESWDNPGLLAGRREKEVHKVFLALDATDQVIERAVQEGADLLLTHHPLLFSPIKQVSTDTMAGRRLIRMIQADLTYYAMHTNYDVVTMAPLSGQMLGLLEQRVLEVTRRDEETGREEGFGRVGLLPQPMSLEVCGELVKKVFGLEHVKVFGDFNQVVARAAISPGSGKSMIEPAIRAGAEVLITGDIGHHEGIDARAEGLAIIDAGHYGLEHIFMGHMAEFLRERWPDLEIVQEEIENPFRII